MSILLTQLVLAQGGSPPQGIIQFVPILLIFGIFYFLLIAPMRKRQKALQALVDAVGKGDKVITNGGLYGEIAAVHDGWVVLKIADNVKVRIAKSAISGLEGQSEKEAAK